MSNPIATRKSVILDNIGKEIYSESAGKIKVRKIMFNNEIPVNVIDSDNVKNCFTMNLESKERQIAMSRVAGESLMFQADSINQEMKGGDALIINPFFGGRAFDLISEAAPILNKGFSFYPFGLKVERETDAQSKTGWQLQLWGAADKYSWSFDKPWEPLTSAEKNSLRNFKRVKGNQLLRIEDAIQNMKKTHNGFNVGYFYDGAFASSTTSIGTLELTRNLFEKHDIKFPSHLRVLGIYMSGKSIKTLWNYAKSKNIKIDFCVAGAIIKVRKVGIIPFLVYTDLPPCCEKTMIYSSIYEHFLPYATNRKGQITKICSCDDVGLSLDEWIRYIVNRLITFYLFDIDPQVIGFEKYAVDDHIRQLVIDEVKKIETTHLIRLRTIYGEYLLANLTGEHYHPAAGQGYVF